MASLPKLCRVSTDTCDINLSNCSFYNSLETASLRGTKPVWILAHDSMKQLAEKVIDCCINWQQRATQVFESHEFRHVEFVQSLSFDTFPDGYPNLFIKDVKKMAGKDIIFIASFHSVDVLFEQLSIMYSLPRYLAHSVTVILPYFPTGTMERIDLEGQIATARSLAIMLSQIPSTARGPTQLMIFDIHALQERFYFSNDIIPRLETAVPLLLLELAKSKWQDVYIRIAFPDEGAQKRFGRQFPETMGQVVCSKTRDGENRIVKIREGNPDGAHVILVDDLVQTGGTLIESAKVLKANGATEVSAFVVHAVFPQESWKRFTDTENVKSIFSNFWITDSIPHAVEIAKHSPFVLKSLAPVIADSLLGFDLRQWE